ncbi:MAG: tRNA (N(6)-L-threonylcarbamoyladenosine(37)-C(2))-methylthiotransferase MtaB [Terriglobales bacterium]
MSSFYLENFGCRANQAEGAALASRLEGAGLRRQAAPEGAAWLVVNTCTVTAAADCAARHAVRRLARRHPQARIAVTGCYAQRAPAELAALPGVAAVLGHQEKWGLPARLGPRADAATAAARPPSPDWVPAAELAPPAKLATLARLARTRPIVKVQEGCSRHCSYCIVPQVRGASRSRPLGAVLEEITALARAGVQEVVLSGINLGQWGRELDRHLELAALVEAVLRQTPIPRLRLSSVEPMDWTPGLTTLFAADPRLCRHAHLPLQSGSDTVLHRMRRRYRAARYAACVRDLHQRSPGIAIGADVLAGFPAESEAEFAETCALIQDLPLAYLHVFPFSARPGTEADRQLTGGAWPPVPPATIARRAATLRQLGAAKRAAFLECQCGARLTAVTLDETTAAGAAWALTGNYCRVALDRPLPPNRLVEAEITAAEAASHLRGRVWNNAAEVGA